jgi:hypothetical protein
MDGWDWDFTYDKAKKALSFFPVRWEYRLLHPIVTVAKAELVMDYYPNPGAKIPKRFASQMPIEQLQLTNTFYFGTY